MIAVLPVFFATRSAKMCMPSLMAMTPLTRMIGSAPISIVSPFSRRPTDCVMISNPTMPVNMATTRPAMGWARL